MVTVARTKTGLWHLLGRFGCQDADPSQTRFEERKSLDEYEFRNDPIQLSYPPIGSDDDTADEQEAEDADTSEDAYPEERVDDGIRDVFFKRCRRTLAHWIGLREMNLLPFRVRLAETCDDREAPGKGFQEIASRGEADETCDICGKPGSARWHRPLDERHKAEYDNTVENVCMTCYRAIKQPLTDSQKRSGEYRAGLNEEITDSSTPLQTPRTEPKWYRVKQRQENPQTDRDKAVMEIGEKVERLSVKMASKLYDAGIESIEALAGSDPEDMTDIKSIGEVKASTYIENAREAQQRGE